MRVVLGALIVGIAGASLTASAESQGLFLSKSAGFEHSCIKWDANKNSHVNGVLTGLCDEIGAKILCTKDASLINADNLKQYQLVIFFTTMDLTQTGTDGQPAMGPNGVAELLEWVGNGGGFMGFHCASDTFHTPDGQPVTPFLEMLGGEFRGHGAQFEGVVRTVDASHPAMASIPADWTIKDEWYLFKNLNTKSIHVLAVLDPGPEREKQEMYNIPSYPIAWCSEYGKGRVFYNGMGHREDVWDNPDFQKHVVDAAHWVMGQGPANAAPNFDAVVKAEDAAAIQGIAKKE